MDIFVQNMLQFSFSTYFKRYIRKVISRMIIIIARLDSCKKKKVQLQKRKLNIHNKYELA